MGETGPGLSHRSWRLWSGFIKLISIRQKEMFLGGGGGRGNKSDLNLDKFSKTRPDTVTNNPVHKSWFLLTNAAMWRKNQVIFLNIELSLWSKKLFRRVNICKVCIRPINRGTQTSFQSGYRIFTLRKHK